MTIQTVVNILFMRTYENQNPKHQIWVTYGPKIGIWTTDKHSILRLFVLFSNQVLEILYPANLFQSFWEMRRTRCAELWKDAVFAVSSSVRSLVQARKTEPPLPKNLTHNKNIRDVIVFSFFFFFFFARCPGASDKVTQIKNRVSGFVLESLRSI